MFSEAWLCLSRTKHIRNFHHDAVLISGHPLTLADAALEYGRMLLRDLSELPRRLREEKNRSPEIFKKVATSPDRCERHHRMLQSYARHDYLEVPKLPLLEDPSAVVLDVGSGSGTLGKLFAQEYPQAGSETSCRMPRMFVLKFHTFDLGVWKSNMVFSYRLFSSVRLSRWVLHCILISKAMQRAGGKDLSAWFAGSPSAGHCRWTLAYCVRGLAVWLEPGGAYVTAMSLCRQFLCR